MSCYLFNRDDFKDSGPVAQSHRTKLVNDDSLINLVIDGTSAFEQLLPIDGDVDKTVVENVLELTDALISISLDRRNSNHDRVLSRVLEIATSDAFLSELSEFVSVTVDELNNRKGFRSNLDNTYNSQDIVSAISLLILISKSGRQEEPCVRPYFFQILDTINDLHFKQGVGIIQKNITWSKTVCLDLIFEGNMGMDYLIKYVEKYFEFLIQDRTSFKPIEDYLASNGLLKSYATGSLSEAEKTKKMRALYLGMIQGTPISKSKYSIFKEKISPLIDMLLER